MLVVGASICGLDWLGLGGVYCGVLVMVFW